jgi:large subunit ribosomal protein L24
MNIRRNDQVVVIRGASRAVKKGKDTPRHRVLKTLPGNDKVIVEGVNYIWKHVRRSDKNPTGGRIQKEAPIHASNVMLWCEKCLMPVKHRMALVERKRMRLCRKCGEPIVPKKR